MKLYTTPEQTEKIYEITGVKPKDLHPVSDNGGSKFSVCTMTTAYDIGELLSLLPEEKGDVRIKHDYKSDWSVGLLLMHPDSDGTRMYCVWEPELIDALVRMIERLKEGGLI